MPPGEMDQFASYVIKFFTRTVCALVRGAPANAPGFSSSFSQIALSARRLRPRAHSARVTRRASRGRSRLGGPYHEWRQRHRVLGGTGIEPSVDHSLWSRGALPPHVMGASCVHVGMLVHASCV